MSYDPQSQVELWRMAVHEAAHWIFSEWAGVGNVEHVTIIPAPERDSLGHCCVPLRNTFSPQGVRLAIMMLCAGRVAENVFTGTRRMVDGTDFAKAHALAGRGRAGNHLILSAHIEVEQYLRGVLWVPVLTAASLLYEAKTIERKDARDIWFCVQPAGQPWLLTPLDAGKGQP